MPLPPEITNFTFAGNSNIRITKAPYAINPTPCRICGKSIDHHCYRISFSKSPYDPETLRLGYCCDSHDFVNDRASMDRLKDAVINSLTALIGHIRSGSITVTAE